MLGDDFVRILAPAVELQAELMKIDSKDIFKGEAGGGSAIYGPRRITCGELFSYKGEVFGVTVRGENRRQVKRDAGGNVTGSTYETVHHIALAHIDPSSTPSGASQKFMEAAKRAFGANFEKYSILSERAQEFLEEQHSSTVAPTDEEVSASHLLSDKLARKIAIDIKSAPGGVLLSDLPKRVAPKEKPKIAPMQLELVKHSLVVREFVVVCNKAGTPVMRFPSKEALTAISNNFVRCSCGSDVAQERVEEALSVTSDGRSLLDKSHWMNVYLINELMRLGIGVEEIFIEQQSGEDEMDCIAIIGGNLVLFELKDKDFTLGNAYSFGAKIGILRPDVSIIVTTEKVAADARDHFDRARAARLQSSYKRGRSFRGEETASEPLYIEGLNNLHAELSKLTTKLYRSDAEHFLDTVLPLASMGPS